jgi:hypothetical protein
LSGRSKAKDNLDKTEKKTRPKLKDYNLADIYQKSFFTTFTLYFKVNVGLKGKILILVLVVNFNAGVVLVLLFFCQFFFVRLPLAMLCGVTVKRRKIGHSTVNALRIVVKV